MAFGVSDFHELVSLLEQHPEWRRELRLLLLSDELLALPDLVRELAEGQKRTDEAVRELVESQKRTDETVRELVQSQRRTDEQIRQLTARVDDLTQRLEQLTARVDDLTRRLEQLTARVDDLTQRLQQLTARVDDLAQRLQQLTARVDDLTQRLEQLTARVDDLARRLQQLTARVEQLGQRVDELTASVASLARSMERVSQDVAKMKGYYLEQRYYQRAPAYFSKIVRRVRAVSYEDLCRLLDDAMDAGTLTEDERDDLIETDVVVYGRKRTDGEEVYLIVEVSWGIGPSDVSRASQRARTFSKLGWQTLPVVAGEWADDDAKEAARRNGVVILLDGGLVFGAV